jgi:light-regulated signal transduction histidine kinase (bacteriophytochrome)
LQQKYKDKSDPESEKYFNYLLQSTARMKALIRELLEYSRLGSNAVWQEVDSQVIVQEVLADLSDAIRRCQMPSGGSRQW